MVIIYPAEEGVDGHITGQGYASIHFA